MKLEDNVGAYVALAEANAPETGTEDKNIQTLYTCSYHVHNQQPPAVILPTKPKTKKWTQEKEYQ